MGGLEDTAREVRVEVGTDHVELWRPVLNWFLLLSETEEPVEGMDRKSVCVFCCTGFQGSTDSGQEVLQGSSRRGHAFHQGNVRTREGLRRTQQLEA